MLYQLHIVISYTESYRDLQESYQAIQLCYRFRKFKLEYSMSAPVRSSVHRNGTYPTLKTFLRFFKLLEFQGRRSSGRLRKRGLDLYNFLTKIENLCGWRLNWLEDIQLSYHRPQPAHAKRPDILFSDIFLKLYYIIKS